MCIVKPTEGFLEKCKIQECIQDQDKVEGHPSNHSVTYMSYVLTDYKSIAIQNLILQYNVIV